MRILFALLLALVCIPRAEATTIVRSLEEWVAGAKLIARVRVVAVTPPADPGDPSAHCILTVTAEEVMKGEAKGEIQLRVHAYGPTAPGKLPALVGKSFHVLCFQPIKDQYWILRGPGGLWPAVQKTYAEMRRKPDKEFEPVEYSRDQFLEILRHRAE